MKKNKSTAFMPMFLGKYGKYSKWIEAQAKHETSNFTSRAFKELNNAFGMKHASKRKQLGIDSGDVYRKYSSLSESIQDLVLWFKDQNFPIDLNSPSDYAMELKNRGYYTDSYQNYYNGIKSFL